MSSRVSWVHCYHKCHINPVKGPRGVVFYEGGEGASFRALLTHKAPIDDSHKYFFIVFQRK